MTKQAICFNCSGRGFVNRSTENSMWSEQCEECHGSGVEEVPMTNFDRIKNMSIDEIAERAIFELRSIVVEGYMSLIDATVYSTRELAKKHNKEWLEREVAE